MLKIKDNVDLKELKRYGFSYYSQYKYYRYNNEKGSIHYVFEGSRKISTNVDKYPDNYEIHTVIYDLIQADLVEKVEV